MRTTVRGKEEEQDTTKAPGAIRIVTPVYSAGTKELDSKLSSKLLNVIDSLDQCGEFFQNDEGSGQVSPKILIMGKINHGKSDLFCWAEAASKLLEVWREKYALDETVESVSKAFQSVSAALKRQTQCEPEQAESVEHEYDLSMFDRPKEEVSESIRRLEGDLVRETQKFSRVELHEIEYARLHRTEDNDVDVTKETVTSPSKCILRELDEGCKISDRYFQKAGDIKTVSDGYVVLSVTLVFYEPDNKLPVGKVKISLCKLEGTPHFLIHVEPWLKHEGAEIAHTQQAA